MLKVVKWIVIVLVAVIALLVIVGLFLPSEYHVTRSVVIDAEREQIHTLVGDLKQWLEWDPWRDMDPTIETVYGETSSGVGAHQTWTGESGSGELTFTRCDPASGVVYDMAFDEGKYRSVGSMLYEPVAGGTKVTWDWKGDSGMNIVGRYLGLFMDGMVGPAFEAGLRQLKQKAEALEPPAPPAEEIEQPSAEPVEKTA